MTRRTRSDGECHHGVAAPRESWVGLVLYDDVYQDAIGGGNGDAE